MKNISTLPDSPGSSCTVNNRGLKIPSNVSAAFAPDKDSSSEHACVSYIYDSFTSQSSVDSQFMKKWRNAALVLTVVVTVLSLVFSLLFFVLSSEVDSSSVLVIAMDALFAIFGAGFVLWRFCGPNEKEVVIYREKAGSLFFGAGFILSGSVTFGISTFRLLESSHPQKPISVVIALGVFVFLIGILTFALFKVARKLNSPVVMALTIDTFFAVLLSFGVFTTELVYLQTCPKFWYLDHAVSVAVSLFFVLCGISLVTKVCVSKTPE